VSTRAFAFTFVSTAPLIPIDAFAPRVVAISAATTLPGKLVPPPDRPSRVPTLDAAVEIVPVIQHAELQPWCVPQGELAHGLVRLQSAEQRECSIQRADTSSFAATTMRALPPRCASSG
jgi:hypothetical protein